MRQERMADTSRSLTTTLPLVGVTSWRSSFTMVDLPEPDGPMKKTKSPLSIATETPSSDGRAAFGYVFVTFSSRITDGVYARHGIRQLGGSVPFSPSGVINANKELQNPARCP